MLCYKFFLNYWNKKTYGLKKCNFKNQDPHLRINTAANTRSRSGIRIKHMQIRKPVVLARHYKTDFLGLKSNKMITFLSCFSTLSSDASLRSVAWIRHKIKGTVSPDFLGVFLANGMYEKVGQRLKWVHLLVFKNFLLLLWFYLGRYLPSYL